MANALVSLNGGNDMPYDMQLAQIKRQQQMADALQQQMAQPIDVQQGGGAPAAISWGSVLAKALQGVSGQMRENYAQNATKQLGVQDSAASQALLKQLQGPEVAQVGTQNIAPQAAQMSVPNPMGGAPAKAQVQMPAAHGTGMQMARQAPTLQEQMAMLLGAQGNGPRTDAIAQAMLPQIMNRQNTEWERSQPMSVAAQQQIKAQTEMSQQDALFKNGLPLTAAERAQMQMERAKLQETQDFHKQQTGAGVLENGLPNPVVESYKSQVLAGNMTLANVPAGMRGAVATAMNSAPDAAFSPTAKAKMTMASSKITAPYTNMSAYKLTADAKPYLERINAARQTPGSVSDQDLLDSLTKLNTGGNAVTEAQVSTITGGKSYADWAGTLANKFKNGGVLSDNQRKQIVEIAGHIYDNYKSGYQPVYEKAAAQLTAAGIPKQFWTIPDLNAMDAPQKAAGPSIAPAGTKAVGPGGKTLTSDGKGGWQ